MTRHPLGGPALLLLMLIAATAAAQAPVPSTPGTTARPVAQLAPVEPAAPGFDQQFRAAQQLARDGKRDEALAAFTALLARAPGNADVLLARGRLHAWAKRWPEAESDLTAATRAKPQYADAWSALGDLYRWSDRPAQAAAAYQRWSQLAPQDPAPRLARGRALRLAGEVDAARAEFEAARGLGADPADVDRGLASLQPRSLAPDAIAPEGFDWTLRLDGSQNWVSGASFRDSQSYGLSARRHFGAGSLAGEVLRVHRFGKSDTSYALDSYVDLWPRAYANLRYQVAPDHTLFPENSGRVELYQGVGQGWEPAASYDWLNFSSSSVSIYGAALAKYVGAYYGRLRVTYVDPSGSTGWRLTLRDYYRGDADHYLELNGGTSRGDTTSGGITFTEHSESVGVAWVTFFTPRWGFKVGADYSHSSLNESGFSATLYSRW